MGYTPSKMLDVIAAGVLAVVTGLLAAGIGVTGFHIRIWTETLKCHEPMASALTLHPGDEPAVIYGEGSAPVVVDRTTVLCRMHSGEMA